MFVSFIVYLIFYSMVGGVWRGSRGGGGGGERDREREEEIHGFFQLPKRGGEGVRILLSLRGGIR